MPREFDGDTAGTYTDVVFPEGFDLIRYDETVLPTWFVHPEPRSVGASLSYWRRANDTVDAGTSDRTLGTVPPDPPEAVVFAGDGQLIARWGGALEAAETPPTMIVGA